MNNLFNSTILPDISEMISTILADTAKEVGHMLIVRAGVINSFFDDAYGSCLGGHYASGMELAASGLLHLDGLLDYADTVMSTADASAWEYVRDSLGSVRLDKAPLERNIIAEYDRRIKRYVSPTFGNSPKQYVVKEHRPEDLKNCFEITTTENPVVFQRAVSNGTLVNATLTTLGAVYVWNTQLKRWVFDCLVNPAVRPDLEKYM